MAIAVVDNSSPTSGDLNDEAWDIYNATVAALLVEHSADGTHGDISKLQITPSDALGAGEEWEGINIDGGALDPSAANAIIHGLHIDLGGVLTTNDPEIEALHLEVPVGYTSIHVDEQMHIDMDLSSLVAGVTRTGLDLVALAVGATGGDFHALDVATAGTTSATLVAVGTHTGIDVIHQHVGAFAGPDQAWRYVLIGTTYTSATTAFGSAGTDLAIFQADNDVIYVGGTAAFDEIEVCLETAASVDLKIKFEYSKAASWAEFDPGDDTEGFTQDGIIRFDSSALSNFAAQSVNSVSKYYIRMTRTKNTVITSPTEDTIKILAATEYSWDKLGAITSLSVNTGTLIVTGKVFINDTANAKALGPSLTIDGEGQDGEYLTLQDSTDVAHGITDDYETGTFFVIKKAEPASGGATLIGLKDADENPQLALQMIGFLGENANTLKTTAGYGIINLVAGIKNGTAAGSVNADGNLISIADLGTVRFVFDAEGEMHSDAVIGEGSDWDEWDDLALASDLSRLPKARFNEMMKYKAKDFEKAGLLTLSKDEQGVEHAFIRHKAMLQFSMCCFAEIHDKLQKYEKAFDRLGITRKELLAVGRE